MARLTRNPNGTNYCEDCHKIVILFDDDEHWCVECFWGETNEYADCVPVQGNDIDGHAFCEIHSDIMDEYDEEERDYMMEMLKDSHQ